jgi:hypothetical protein
MTSKRTHLTQIKLLQKSKSLGGKIIALPHSVGERGDAMPTASDRLEGLNLLA